MGSSALALTVSIRNAGATSFGADKHHATTRALLVRSEVYRLVSLEIYGPVRPEVHTPVRPEGSKGSWSIVTKFHGQPHLGANCQHS